MVSVHDQNTKETALYRFLDSIVTNAHKLTASGKCNTCSEEGFSLARLNLIRQPCVVLRETFVQLGKNFREGATIPGH